VAGLKTVTHALNGEIVLVDHKKISHFELLPQEKTGSDMLSSQVLYANGRDFQKNALSERGQAIERSVQVASSLLLTARLAEEASCIREKC
jgi:ATP-dependent DNA ligase